jgi:DNA-binding LacI/PurR family transcriptional regulator
MEAYREQMEARGLEPVYIEVQYEDAEPAVERIRSLPEPPSAVCCWNDVTALILLDACHRAGLRTPDDLAVIGFDGLLDARLVWQRLTTVSAHWPEVTAAALVVLRSLLSGEPAPRETVVPASLRLGDTA